MVCTLNAIRLPIDPPLRQRRQPMWAGVIHHPPFSIIVLPNDIALAKECNGRGAIWIQLKCGR